MSAPKATCPDCRQLKSECSCPLPPRCPRCLDDGYVCEDHPEKPWEGIHGAVEDHAEHGGIGMPCPACCSPVPEDGTYPVTEAFVPDWKRTA